MLRYVMSLPLSLSFMHNRAFKWLREAKKLDFQISTSVNRRRRISDPLSGLIQEKF